MTDKNPHLSSNRLIAAAFESGAIGKPGDSVIGVYRGVAITKLHFEAVAEDKASIRAVLTSQTGSPATISKKASKLEDVHDFLVNQCEISADLVQSEFAKFVETQVTQPLSYSQRFLEAEEFNEAQKKASPGLLNQFEAEGLSYSIVHQSSYRTVNSDPIKDQTVPEFYTVYVQNSAIKDPDQCLVNTDSFDTLFEAVGFCRTHIEQRLFKAFMPELMK